MRKLLLVIVGVLLMVGQSRAQTPDVTITGKMQGANGLPAANSIMSFTPSQSFFVATAGDTPAGDNIYGNGAPTGICLVSGQFYTNISVSPPALYQCINGAWVPVTAFTNYAFSAITSGVNNTAAMNVGTGASLFASGTGSIAATTAPAAGLTGNTIASAVVNSSLTGLGTVTTGIWDATAIASGFGGTGINSSGSTGVAQVLAGVWSISPALANGTTAVTQTNGDTSADVATDAFVQNAVSGASGGVQSLTVQSLNGISGSFTSGSTPVLTLALGAITPTSVQVGASSVMTGTTGTGTLFLSGTTATRNSGNLLDFNAAGDGIDSGIASSNVPLLNGVNNFTGVANSFTAQNVFLATPSTATSVSGNFGSTILHYTAQFYNGLTGVADNWTTQDILGLGTNPTSSLTYTHVPGGSWTGTPFVLYTNAYLGIGQAAGSGIANVLDTLCSSTSTILTTANPCDHRVGNSSQTVSSYEGFIAAADNSAATEVTMGRLEFVNTLLTSGTETGDLHIILRDAGDLADRWQFLNTGVFQNTGGAFTVSATGALTTPSIGAAVPGTGAFTSLNASSVQSSQFYGGVSLTVSALNTNFALFSDGLPGLIVIRDATTGGSAVFLLDGNQGPLQIANQITGLTVNIAAANFNVQLTSGTIPRLLQYAFLRSS